MRKLLLCGALLAIFLTSYVALDRDRSASEATPRLSGAARSLIHWNAQRAYPGKTLPARGLTDAYEYSRANLAEDQQKSRDPWRALGPHNIGGRTLAVALNPQNPATVYAGSASGGLWRSHTGGVGAAAWEYVPTGHPVLGVSTVAIDPGDSNVMYIGTGEVYSYDNAEGGISVRYTRGSYGIGILKTIDGGATWSKSLDWSYHQERGIWAVRFNPLNPNTVWAATTEGTYKSLDAGESWTPVHDVIMANDLVIDPGDTNRVFVGCGNFGSAGQGIYRTTNGGGSWSKMEQPGVIPEAWAGKTQLAVSPAEPGTVYASLANGDVGTYWTRLLRSTDGGESWAVRSTADYARWQGWFAHDVAVSPFDGNLVIAVGIDIWRSLNGGLSLTRRSDWSQWYFGQTIPGEPEGPPNYSHADHHDVVFHPTDPDIIYFANDGGIFRSLDGGETFEGCNGGYQTQQFYAGFSSSPLDPDLALGGMQDNSTAIYLGTNAWYRAIGGDGSWTGIDPEIPGTMFGSAQFLQMFRSHDFGGEWTAVSPPAWATGEPGFIAPFGLGHGPGGGQIIYAAGTKVAKSDNGGDNWSSTHFNQDLDGNPALALEVAASDPDVVYVTTAPVVQRAGVFRTEDGGFGFVDITGTLPDRYLVGLAIDPADSRRVYVTASGFGTSHVFRSFDAGDSWQDIGAGLPDVPTSAVVVDPQYPQMVYVGNDLGVYYTSDGGMTWSEFSLGLPGAVMAMDLTISPVDRMLRVSTYGNGVFERELASYPVRVSDGVPVAGAIDLGQNYPNPFNPSTVIEYSLGREGPVTLTVTDAAGRKVRTLVQGRMAAGEYSVVWDGTDEAGRRVASGAYVYRLRGSGEVRGRVMTLLK